MKNGIHWRALRPIILLIWGLFALVLTTQTDQVPVVKLVGSTIGSTEVGATIGHAGLFGVLTLLCYLALAIFMQRHSALLLALVGVLLLATTTELFQTVVSGRSSSLSDLLANWLGIFIVSFAIAYTAMRSKTTAFQLPLHKKSL
jgi:hypothetical protein